MSFYGYGQCPFTEADFADGGSFSGTCTLDVGGSNITITGNVIWTGGTLTIENTAGGAAIMYVTSGGLTIQNGGTVQLTDLGRFEISSGAEISVESGGGLITTGTGDNIVYDGGSFTSSGNVVIGGDLFIDGGDVTIDGGVFTIFRLPNEGDIEISGDGTLTITDGIVGIQDDILINTGSTGSINIYEGVDVGVGGDVLINGGEVIVDGTLTAGDDIEVSEAASLYGTNEGGVLNFGGTYIPDPDCPYPQNSIDFCSCTVSGCLSVLPIVLEDFIAKRIDELIILEWETLTELNNDRFIIERLNLMTDEFLEVGRLAGKGTTNESSQYTFTDVNPLNGRNYYRLKQIDFDGRISYSPIAWVDFQSIKSFFRIYPNPVSDGHLKLEFTLTDQVRPHEVVIKDVMGRVVLRSAIVFQPEMCCSRDLDVSELHPGYYIISFGPTSANFLVQK